MSSLRMGRWKLDWEIRDAALEHESGDLEVIAPFMGGVLIAAIDGLGHGYEAARAAFAIASVLKDAPSEPIVGLVQRCHVSARPTRGAVLTLARFYSEQSVLEWCGIGNVEGRLFRAGGAARSASQGQQRASEAVTQRGGVVGYQLPRVHVSQLTIANGDVLVLATDGIKSGFEAHVCPARSPIENVDRIFAHSFRGTDDALVLVAQFSRGDS